MIPNRWLNAVFVGKSKEHCTSEVDQNLTVVDASRFGQYVKLMLSWATVFSPLQRSQVQVCTHVRQACCNCN